MVVQHNLRAMNANRMLNVTASEQSKTSEKLSSGYRINRAADDAAGLAISETMRKQIRGLNQASRNAQDGISFVQTVEGAFNEITEMLQRANELGVQAATGTTNATQDKYIGKEIDQLKTEINRIISATNFNGQKAFGTSITIFVGDEVKTSNDIAISATNFTPSFGTISDDASGKDLVTSIKTDLANVANERARLGAIQNRLEHTYKNLDNISENVSASESRIRDTDMSTEMVKHANNQILAQAGQAMLAQSNQANQGVLSLLQ